MYTIGFLVAGVVLLLSEIWFGGGFCLFCAACCVKSNDD